MYTVCEPLAIIINNSLLTGTVPDLWKEAIVKPIFKNKDKSCVDNYRPVSLTCTASKICEKVIISPLTEYLESHNLLSSAQAGFRSNRSISTQLVETVSKFHRYMRNGNSFDCVYFDFRKAFDSLDHRLLLHKLYLAGIRDPLLRWFRNFLYGRTQAVSVDNAFSQKSPVLSGVPQGSCIGPLLFILFIDDITDQMPPGVSCGLYADDLKIAASVVNSSTLQTTIDSISDWAIQWNMKLSAPKCLVLHFGPLQNRTSFSIDNVALSTPETVRDLGIVMNSQLYFNDHIRNIVAKAMSRANNILRCFKSKSKALLIKAFVVYVRPLLESATEVWNPTAVNLVTDVEYVQRNYTRRVLARVGHAPLPYSARRELFSLETLEYRRALRDLIFIYKCIHGHIQLDTTCLFEHAPLHRNLRATHNLRIRLPFNIYGTRRSSCFSRFYIIWNNLPEKLVNSASVDIFYKGLRSLPENIVLPKSHVLD